MIIQTSRFGGIEVDDRRFLSFSKGLLGFPDDHGGGHTVSAGAGLAPGDPASWITKFESVTDGFPAMSGFLAGGDRLIDRDS